MIWAMLLAVISLPAVVLDDPKIFARSNQLGQKNLLREVGVALVGVELS
jgi:hypothetical protein